MDILFKQVCIRCKYLYDSIDICIYIYVYMYLCINDQLNKYIYIYIQVCEHIYICIHTWGNGRLHAT